MNNNSIKISVNVWWRARNLRPLSAKLHVSLQISVLAKLADEYKTRKKIKLS